MLKLKFLLISLIAIPAYSFQFGGSVEIGSPIAYTLDQTQIIDLDFRFFVKLDNLKFGAQIEQVNWDRDLTYDRIDENIPTNNDEPTGIENRTMLTGVYFTYDFLRFESVLFYFGANAGQALRRFTYIDSTNQEEYSESIGEYYGAQVGGSFHLNENIDLTLEYLYHFLSDDIEEFLDEEDGNYEMEMDNVLDMHMVRLLLTFYF